MWIKGIWWYSMAIPLNATSCVFYFVDFAKIKWMGATERQSISADVEEITKIYYFRQEDSFGNSIADDWRMDVVALAHWIPAFALTVEFLLNRTKINWRHYWHPILLVTIFYLTLWMNENYVTMHPYQDNLAFKCQNMAYLYDSKKNLIDDNLQQESCFLYENAEY